MRRLRGQHEEAMAIDIMVRLKRQDGHFEYLPIQIKSKGSSHYDQTERYLTVNETEKRYIERFLPETKGLFQRSDRKKRFRLLIRRNVAKIGLNERKIVKKHKKDLEPDIANGIMTIVEHAKQNNRTLVTRKPYQQYPYAAKVVLMIKSGFITPIQDEEYIAKMLK